MTQLNIPHFFYALHHSWQVYLAGTNPKRYQISANKSNWWLKYSVSFKNPTQITNWAKSSPINIPQFLNQKLYPGHSTWWLEQSIPRREMLSGLGGPSDVGLPYYLLLLNPHSPFTKSHRDTYLQSLYLLSYSVLAAKMKRSRLFTILVLSNRVSDPRETTYCWFPGLLGPVGRN